jgi:large subunit ribosomal protein L11
MCQLKSTVEAQEAKTAPPLGPLLAQFKLEMLKVCKELNEKTKNYESGVPLPVKIEIDESKAYEIYIGSPTINFLYDQLKDEKEFTILLFYDLLRLVSVYHKVEIKKPMVFEVLSTLSSMKVKNVNNKKKKKS